MRQVGRNQLTIRGGCPTTSVGTPMTSCTCFVYLGQVSRRWQNRVLVLAELVHFDRFPIDAVKCLQGRCLFLISQRQPEVKVAALTEADSQGSRSLWVGNKYGGVLGRVTVPTNGEKPACAAVPPQRPPHLSGFHNKG